MALWLRVRGPNRPFRVLCGPLVGEFFLSAEEKSDGLFPNVHTVSNCLTDSFQAWATKLRRQGSFLEQVTLIYLF